MQQSSQQQIDSPNKKSKFRRWIWITLAIIVLLAPYPFEAGGPFRLLSVKHSEVHTRVSGSIEKVFVKEGDWVEPGQTIATLDTREHQQSLDVITAQLEKAQAHLELLEAGAKAEHIDKAKQLIETAQAKYDYSSLEAKRFKDVRDAGGIQKEVERARANLAAAQATYNYTNSEEKRLKIMYDAGVIPKEEYDKSVKNAEVDAKNLEAAKANLEAVEDDAQRQYDNKMKTADVDAKNLEVTKANLKLVKSGTRPEQIEAQKALIRDLQTRAKFREENIKLSVIAASVPGQIITPYMENKVNRLLKTGALVATIEDSRTIQAELQLPEEDIGEVAINASVRVRLWAYPLKTFPGHVVSIAPIANQMGGARVVRVITELPNPTHELKPYMTGDAKIAGGSKPVIVAFTRWLVRFFMVEVWSWFP